MSWLAVDQRGVELIFKNKPELIKFNGIYRWTDGCYGGIFGSSITLPKGTIKKITGHDRNWRVGPVRISNEA